MTEAFGQTIALDFHRRRPDRVAELLADAGLAVRTRVLREAEPDERTAQAYLLARREPDRHDHGSEFVGV